MTSIIMPTPAIVASLGGPPDDPALASVYKQFLRCASITAHDNGLAQVAEAYERVRVVHAHRRGVLDTFQAPGIALALVMPLPRWHRAQASVEGPICLRCSSRGTLVAGPCAAEKEITGLVRVVTRLLAVGRLREPPPEGAW